MMTREMITEPVRFRDLFQVKHGFAFKGQFFSDKPGDVILTPGNFLPSGGLQFREGKDRSYQSSYPKEFRLSSGDMLVVMTDLTQEARILGSPAFVPSEIRCLHNQRLGKIVGLDSKRLDRGYLYYLMCDPEYRLHLKATATGSTVKHTSPGRIGDFVVHLPNLAYQKRIALMLAAYDDLIEVNRRRVAILEEMARRLFEEWFVHLRFPGHETVPVHDTPDGPLPEGWTWQPLSNACVDGNGIQTGPFGSQLHQSDYTVNGVPVVMPRDLIEFRVSTSSIARIPEPLADLLSRHRMRVGDIVYGRRGDIGRRAYIAKREHGWFCGTGSLRLRPNTTRASPRYLFQALGMRNTLDNIRARAQGATMPNLGAAVLAKVPVLLPPLATQDRYSIKTEPIFDLVTALLETNAQLTTARDLLLPRLISGELSVADAEAAAPEPFLEAAD